MGALMVHVGPDMVGAEIGISPVDPSTGSAHTHTDVRERQLGTLSTYAAVFPSLVAGDYLLDDPRGGPPRPVTISGGRVAQLDWRPAQP
jgi:hypothetical protein